MLVLFDNGTPRTLARYLIDHHTVTEARARGWDELENGELLGKAEAAGQGRWSLIKRCVAQVVATVNAATPGSFAEVEIPYE
jgi:hypothetical protein